MCRNRTALSICAAGSVALEGVGGDGVEGAAYINRATSCICAAGNVALEGVAGDGVGEVSPNRAAEGICAAGDVGGENVAADGVGALSINRTAVAICLVVGKDIIYNCIVIVCINCTTAIIGIG